MKLKPVTIGLVTSLLCLGAIVLASKACAEEGQQSPPPSSLQPIEDDPELPRVLLIGDSVSMGYTIRVRQALKGKANVHRPPTNCGSTTKGLREIDSWLGTNKWDVIHFNFGLHDMMQLRKGERNTPLDEYESNLRAITAKLKHSCSVVIWASTTPVPTKLRPDQVVRNPNDVPVYNTIAARVMRGQGVITDDLYALVLPDISQLQPPDNIHFKSRGYEVLAAQVAKTVSSALNKGES